MSYIPSLQTPVSFDSSNRMRVGQLTTLADLKTLNQDEPLLWETVGTGLSAWANNKISLSAVSNGQYVIRKSKQYYPYFSGKSQQIEMTFDSFQTETNIIKRVGYFSSISAAPYDTIYDGMWLEDDGITKRLKVSRAGTETFNVPMSAWTNYSSVASYDWSKFTVMLMDFLWLGGANLRFFIRTTNGIELLHTLSYPGTSQDTFTKSPNQPLRYEIRSTGGNGAFRPICAQVSTEGSINEHGKQRSSATGIAAGTTGYIANTIGTTYPLISIRKLASNRDKAVKVIGIQSAITTNTDTMLVSLILNPSLNGGTMTYTPIPNNSVEIGLPQILGGGGGTNNNIVPTLSGGTTIYSYIATSSGAGSVINLEQDFLSYLGTSIDNVSDVLYVAGTPYTAACMTYTVLDFKEY